MKHPHVDSYAQNREDIILAGFFKDSEEGFYVDVGANDPIEDSVTKYFYERGWRGINIEPIKRHHQALCADRPEDINLQLGVSNVDGELTLREYEGHGLSTFSREMQQSYSDDPTDVTKKYQDYTVKVVTLERIFKQHKVKSIQFMKVDVEGYEYAVLAGNDWTRYRPEIICIEANHVNDDWHPLLKKEGYELAFFDGLNEYFHDSWSKRKREFSYVPAVINREPIFNGKARLVMGQNLFEEREKHTAFIENLQREVATLSQEVVHLERYNQELLQRLDDIASLRKHARKVAVKHLRRLDGKIVNRLDRRTQFKPVDPASGGGDIEGMLERAKQSDKATAERYADQHKMTKPMTVYAAQKRAVRRILKRGRKGA